MKHTPGPWEFHKGTYRIGSPGRAICEMLNTHLRLPSGEKKIRYEESQEMLADAHLIAAAPELLQACEMSLEYFNKSINGEESTYLDPNILEKAISKAKGED